MKKILLAGVAALAGGLLMSAAAQASYIQIGLQEAGVNGGATTQAVTSLTGNIDWSGETYGNFHTSGTVEDTTGAGFGLPNILQSNSLNAVSNAAGTLTVTIISSGLTALDTNVLSWWKTTLSWNDQSPGNGSVTESVYLDTADQTLDTLDLGSATLLGSKSDAGLALGGPFINSTTLTGAYSVVEVYTIAADAGGETFNDTIDESAIVPEPTSLLLLGSGLLAAGGWSRRRSKRAS